MFGTDGVRGLANRDLPPDLALSLGRALAGRLPPGSTVLVGRDTRRSGPMLEGALAAGLASGGAGVLLAGVLPTPAVAELVPEIGAAAGVVISASHNPYEDNGLKVFGADGFKLADAEEAEIERAMADRRDGPDGADVGDVSGFPEARERYLDSLGRRLAVDLSGLRVAVDCANGATAVTAPEALRRLGAEVSAIGVTPDGRNINDACGSTQPDALRRLVREGRHDLGLAFDGDGDRAIAVDGAGEIVDGDRILALCALALHARGRLAGPAVVTTTMTNLGFRRAMAAAGIEVRWTDVGDRYVLEEMRRGGYVLGGEQSGHMINLLHGPTGDGLATGIQLLSALRERGQTLAGAAGVMERLPQRLVSVRVERKADLAEAGPVWDAVRACEEELGEDGRVVVRASGTEPLVRVMVEAPTLAACERWCREIASLAARELGGEPPAG